MQRTEQETAGEELLSAYLEDYRKDVAFIDSSAFKDMEETLATAVACDGQLYLSDPKYRESAEKARALLGRFSRYRLLTGTGVVEEDTLAAKRMSSLLDTYLIYRHADFAGKERRYQERLAELERMGESLSKMTKGSIPADDLSGIAAQYGRIGRALEYLSRIRQEAKKDPFYASIATLAQALCDQTRSALEAELLSVERTAQGYSKDRPLIRTHLSVLRRIYQEYALGGAR